MARHAPLLLTVLAALAVAAASASASAYARAADKDDHLLSIRGRGAGMVGDEEDDLSRLGGLVSRRRLLQDLNANGNSTKPHISYGALRADGIPCGLRGASYYNCHPGVKTNPYTRGCSAITQCRG